KAKDKSHVGSDQHNDYVVDKLSYAVDVDGSYAFSGARNDQNLSTANASVRMEHGNLGPVTINAAALNKAFLDCLRALPQVTDDAAARAKSDQDVVKCIRAGNIDKLVGMEPGKYYYSL